MTDGTPTIPDTDHYVVRYQSGGVCGHKHRTAAAATNCGLDTQRRELRETGNYQVVDVDEHAMPGLPEFPEGWTTTNNCVCF